MANPMQTLDEVDAEVQLCRRILAGISDVSVIATALEDEHWLKLGHALVDRFLHSGRLLDLREAASIYHSAMASPQKDKQTRLAGITGRGMAEALMFELDGDLANITSSIHHLTEALNLALQGSFAYPFIQTQLGHALELRFCVTGASADLEKASDLQKHAMEATRKPHIFHDLCIFNAGELQVRLYTSGNDSAKLHLAIEYFAASVSGRPQGHRDRHAALHGLGTAHLLLHEFTSEPHHLHSATIHLRKAIDCCPGGHPNRGLWLTTYAVALEHLYTASNDSSQLDQVVDLNREALSLVPEGRLQRD